MQSDTEHKIHAPIKKLDRIARVNLKKKKIIPGNIYRKLLCIFIMNILWRKKSSFVFMRAYTRKMKNRKIKKEA